MSTATTIQAAVRDVILPLNLTPRTTLTQQAAAGALTLTVADASHFVPDGIVLFNDALGEPIGTVASVVGSVITLDFTGATPSALAFTHTNSTTVYTNLMTETPMQIGPMLALGDPFIFVTVLDEQERRRSMGRAGHVQMVYSVRIQEHRTLIRPDSQLMAPNRWAVQQQNQARADLDAISLALKQNQSLAGTATALGDMGNPSKPLITRAWHKIVVDRDSQTLVAAMDVVVTTFD